jgi:hypothetical protein
MGNDLIRNYLNTQRNTPQQKTQQASARNYFQNPQMTLPMSTLDVEMDKLVKPLDGKGHLVSDSITQAPKEFVRDTVYTAKAFADGVRGKANDHQLGKMNDLGLKLGGVAIATYLMTKKSTPKTKAMEFIGLGAFLASMSIWPKVALEIPARMIHGFNFRKKYIDDQGRKKEVGLDPNYMPFDLYKGDKPSEDLNIIGDRLGIARNIPNRQEAIKDNMRKICVQNNTMWMMTAGIATPIMTALTCNFAEKALNPVFEKMSNKKVNTSIDEVTDYLNGTLHNVENYETNVLRINPHSQSATVQSPVEQMLKGMRGRAISKEELANLSDTLADGFDAEMKDATRADITRLIGGERYLANSSSASKLAESIHSTILAQDAGLAEKITQKELQEAASHGIIRGAVGDMLTGVATDIIDKSQFAGQQVSTNFKCKELDNIDFFKITEENKNMSEVDRLAHNIKSIVLKVNNSNPVEDFIPGMSDLERADGCVKAQIDRRLQEQADNIAKQFYEGQLAIGSGREEYVRTAITDVYKSKASRGPKHGKIFASVSDVIKNSEQRGYVINESASDTITNVSRQIGKYNAVDRVLSEGAHFKVEKANETLVANNWQKVTDTLVKELGITKKEIQTASKSKELTRELFIKKLDAICSTKEGTNRLLTSLGNVMLELDDKIDRPNEGSSGNMMNKIEEGIKKNCGETANVLEANGMTSMRRKMTSSYSGKVGVNTGSIMSSKLERLHSRVDGVHSSYMRLLSTIDFFNRANGYERELAQCGGNAASIANKYGFTQDTTINEELIRRGKELLLDAHTDKFYNKMGTKNNKDFYNTLMWSVYRTNKNEHWDQGRSSVSEANLGVLDAIKVKEETPNIVFEGKKPLGQAVKEYMDRVYRSMGSITGRIYNGEYDDPLRVPAGVSSAEERASKRFDLVGKPVNEFLHDSLKEKSNANKWMKRFAPVLAATFGITVLSQFFFGKKDTDIKA